MENKSTAFPFAMKAIAIAALLTLAGCATDGEPVEGDFENGNEIPERPGIIESATGKKLEKTF